MATNAHDPREQVAPVTPVYLTGMGALLGTTVGFPVWGLVSFFLSRNVNIDLSLAVAALVTGALGGALAAHMTRTRLERASSGQSIGSGSTS
jgi:hypothetical protein